MGMPDEDPASSPGGVARGWLVAAAVAAVALVALALVLLLRGGGEAPPTVTPSESPGGTAGPTSPATVSPSPGDGTTSAPAPGGQITVPVYYVTDTGTDLKLAREFRSLPDTGGPAVTALTAMLAGQPLDPDYRGLWNPAARILGVAQVDGVIEVDLSQEATSANVGSQGAELAVQSLVYTATGALQSSDLVRILVEGEPVDELFGAVSVGDPVTRGDPVSLRLLVQVNDPNDGATVPTTFTVDGEAAVFEAVLPWRVERPDGSLVTSGTAMTAEGQTFAPYAFELTLDPGDYVVVVEEDDPSAGEGRPPMRDTKRVSVG
ncbi:MAG TPA: GerMN domain-containing protein [Jiangellales bacterium]|nr:GerMN domain-containing protein [Jiangellales bacterium]